MKGERHFHCWLIVFDRSAWRCFFVGADPSTSPASPAPCARLRSSQHLRRNRMKAFSGRLIGTSATMRALGSGRYVCR